MLKLKKSPTLKDIQRYVAKMEKERGFDKETVVPKCLLLGEEVGELYKSIRKSHKTSKLDHNSIFSDAAEEAADIIMVLCAIANRLDIDLEKAFRQKEEKNKKRKWQ